MTLVGRDADGTSCAGCGFAGASIPTDALPAAVMGIPSEYRDVLVRFGPQGQFDVMLSVRDDQSGWSALERIAHVADGLHLATRCAVALGDGDSERASWVHVDAPRAGTSDWPAQVVLASLHASAIDLARTVSRIPLERWDHLGTASAPGTTLRGVVEHALHEARHHLVDVASLLTATAHSTTGSDDRSDAATSVRSLS